LTVHPSSFRSAKELTAAAGAFIVPKILPSPSLGRWVHLRWYRREFRSLCHFGRFDTFAMPDPFGLLGRFRRFENEKVLESLVMNANNFL
jgi:hypothetical protein